MPDERRVNKMDKKRIEQIRQKYDLMMHVNEEADVEFWYARELMELLGYNRWENFDKAVCRAMESCKTSGIEILDHFREVTKMVELKRCKKKKSKTICLLGMRVTLLLKMAILKRRNCFCSKLFCCSDKKAGTYRRTHFIDRKNTGQRKIKRVRKEIISKYL